MCPSGKCEAISNTLRIRESCYGWLSIVDFASRTSDASLVQTAPSGGKHETASARKLWKKVPSGRYAHLPLARNTDSYSGYNVDLKCFVQSYESNVTLDSSILIAPLVLFISPCDPRFINTLNRILLPPEKGGLTSTGFVYRYNTEFSDDGL